MTELICIICPKGCHLQIEEQNGIEISGHSCPRGEEYAQVEITNPTRILTSTVKICGALHRRCPVKTDCAIPKHLIFKAMAQLDEIQLQSPVRLGQIIVENVCGTGANIVSTRNL